MWIKSVYLCSEIMRMKKFRYIVFATLLSFLIIFMGVGVPVVQARCHRCADADTSQNWLAVVSVSGEGCTCGCMASTAQNEANGREGATCACRNHKADRPEKAGRHGEQMPCSSVTIQKLNLPMLGTTIHLDNVVMPVIRLIFDTYTDCFDQLSMGGQEAFYADTSPYRQPPRGYLCTLCTLLI